MPDKIAPKDLETVLARLSKEWQELANLLNSQGSQDMRPSRWKRSCSDTPANIESK
jgi:hypothetical protein